MASAPSRRRSSSERRRAGRTGARSVTETPGGQDGGAFSYFVPRDNRDGGGYDDIAIHPLGQMANDLAVHWGSDVRDEKEYLERIRAVNARVSFRRWCGPRQYSKQQWGP